MSMPSSDVAYPLGKSSNNLLGIGIEGQIDARLANVLVERTGCHLDCLQSIDAAFFIITSEVGLEGYDVGEVTNSIFIRVA